MEQQAALRRVCYQQQRALQYWCHAIFLNGLRHPRTPVSFIRTLDVDAGASTLGGGGHLASLHAAQSALNMTALERQHAAASDGVLLAAETRARTRAADSLSETRRPPETKGLNEKEKQKAVADALRFLDERLAIIRRVRDAMASAQEKQKGIRGPTWPQKQRAL